MTVVDLIVFAKWIVPIDKNKPNQVLKTPALKLNSV